MFRLLLCSNDTRYRDVVRWRDIETETTKTVARAIKKVSLAGSFVSNQPVLMFSAFCGLRVAMSYWNLSERPTFFNFLRRCGVWLLFDKEEISIGHTWLNVLIEVLHKIRVYVHTG